VRLGVGRKDLPHLVTALAPLLDDTSYCADVASGLLYVHGARDFARLQEAARQMDGYAVHPAFPRPLNGDGDSCGYKPESVDLMRKLKARWDTCGLLNPGLLVAS
jgi:hypothetical protein